LCPVKETMCLLQRIVRIFNPRKEKAMNDREKYKRYGVSRNGNFRIIDAIGVPHPYCIGARHVAYASDHFGGVLSAAAIEEAERRGITCCICKGKLSFKEHERALLVECKTEIKGEDGKANSELHEFLLSVKEQVEKDGYAGFAFVRKKA
jgi:hypothetical protein